MRFRLFGKDRPTFRSILALFFTESSETRPVTLKITGKAMALRSIGSNFGRIGGNQLVRHLSITSRKYFEQKCRVCPSLISAFHYKTPQIMLK